MQAAPSANFEVVGSVVAAAQVVTYTVSGPGQAFVAPIASSLITVTARKLTYQHSNYGIHSYTLHQVPLLSLLPSLLCTHKCLQILFRLALRTPLLMACRFVCGHQTPSSPLRPSPLALMFKSKVLLSPPVLMDLRFGEEMREERERGRSPNL
jgi:hypothetical protein